MLMFGVVMNTIENLFDDIEPMIQFDCRFACGHDAARAYGAERYAGIIAR